MDSRLVLTGMSLGLVVAAALALASLPDKQHSMPIQEPLADVQLPGVSSRAEEYAYLLKEYGGRIAVYTDSSSEPEMVLDVLIKYLPDQDRQDLAKGIPVNSYSELVSRIEDYTS